MHQESQKSHSANEKPQTSKVAVIHVEHNKPSFEQSENKIVPMRSTIVINVLNFELNFLTTRIDYLNNF